MSLQFLWGFRDDVEFVIVGDSSAVEIIKHSEHPHPPAPDEGTALQEQKTEDKSEDVFSHDELQLCEFVQDEYSCYTN